MFNQAKLQELSLLNKEFDDFYSTYNSIKSIIGLNEDRLYSEYDSALVVAGTKPFEDFTQELKEMFYRLKLRSLEARLNQCKC